jgi:hypothetical protein
MKKQTAVEWLVKQLKERGYAGEFPPHLLFEMAKVMEKEQIVDAFVECWKENMPDGYECKQSAEYYYNETYEK